MAGERVVLMRDAIIVNNDLRIRLRRLCDGQVAGATVVLAARRVIHQPQDYVLRRGPAAGQVDLTGLNLIIVTDEYKAPRGAIDANGLAGMPPGTAGANGLDAQSMSVEGSIFR
jgi:hypothetical protein